MAAETGVRHGRYLALAALQAAGGGDSGRADRLAEKSKQVAPEDPLVQAVEPWLADDAIVALRPVRVIKTLTRTRRCSPSSFALACGRADEALERLRCMTDRCPNFAGYNLLASQLLVARVVEGRSLSRDRDLEEAFERAIAARDARRTWHGPSAEAVPRPAT